MLILLSITSLLFAKDTCKVQTDCPANNICFQLNNSKTKESTTMCKETKKCSKDTDCGEKQTCTAANICLEKSVKVGDSNHLLDVTQFLEAHTTCKSDSECLADQKCKAGICLNKNPISTQNVLEPVILSK